MKIDPPKLQRLEEAARRENLALRDLEERHRHARGEFARQLSILTEVGFRQASPSPQWLWFECDKNLDRFLEECASRSGDMYTDAARRLRDVLKLRDEADRLKVLLDGQAERWRRSAAALPALREFAKQFRPTHEGLASVRVEDESRGARFFQAMFGGAS